MGNLGKQLKRLSPKERGEIEHLVQRILNRNFVGIECKKLKGVKNLFRVRKGKIRIIFETGENKKPNILSIERRREDTYKF